MVSWNMDRQLARTLRSLSPPYQSQPDGGLEVVVVDNGSDEAPRAEDLSCPGLSVAVHSFPDPAPSPVGAANLGLSLCRGAVIGMWIDGARMATPGLVAACSRICEEHPRAVVATFNYHLGAVPQYHPEARGFTEADEAALLASIDWPRDGYRLFEVGHPAALSGIDGAMLESNAFFMRRALWEELGGYDPGFVSAGGGAANCDLFRRAVELPGAVLFKVVGEATFHQIHGGITSNATDIAAVMKELGREYFRVRGRPLAAVRASAMLVDSQTGTVRPERRL